MRGGFSIRRRIFLLPAAIALAAVLLSGCAPAAPEANPHPEQPETERQAGASSGPQLRTLHTQRGLVTVSTEALDGGSDRHAVQLRRYKLFNGDDVVMGRCTAADSLGSTQTFSFPLDAGGGTLRWYDAAAAQWNTEPLQDGVIRAGCVILTADSGGEYLIYTPKVYELLERSTVRHLPELDGRIRIRTSGDSREAVLEVPGLPAGCAADFTVVRSRDALFDWSDEAGFQAAWPEHDTLDGTGKLCFDGYYYQSPSTYIPSGEHCYYRLPAAYLCKHYILNADGIRAAEDLAIASMDTMAQLQNPLGYFPTEPESEWLSGDYGIGPGFYDTRFNTELAENFYRIAQSNRCREFDAVMERYFDFYLSYASSHHTETASGGWLVEDYYHPGGGSKTHTALNHQLAEILTLYHHAEYLERPELAELGDRMLLAIQDTAAEWIREDGNLHYAVYADGTYGGTDYPYLTYNDLFLLNQYLRSAGRSVPELQRLMEAKLGWMQRQGITGYLQDGASLSAGSA